jgi:oxygen-dependent protoporphyrinogen oxidase
VIAVAGGGITGLATGFELNGTGADAVVLEATSRAGGVIRSAVVDGRVLDWGPQRARLTAGFRGMVERLDLTRELVTASPGLELLIYREGRLRRLPFSVADFAASDVVGAGAKLRALLEPFTGAARPEESVADLFTRKFGRQMYETVIGPLYGGLYASDPADMRVGLSLIHVLREFGIGRSLLLRLLGRGGRIDPPPACSFRGGMQALPDALASRLDDRFRTESPVRRLSRDGSGWRMRVDGAEDIEAEHVVLTTPAPVTSTLLEDAAPAASRTIGRLRYNALAVVHLDAETELRGMGFKVAFGEEDLSLSGVTFNDDLFGRRNLYTAYLGGARNPEVETMDDEELAEVAVRDFRTTTGYDARVLSVARERMPAWDLSWEGLRTIELPDGLHVAGNWWSRPGLPGRLGEAATLGRELSSAAPGRRARASAR